MFISSFLACQSVVKGSFFTYDALTHSLSEVLVPPQFAQTQKVPPLGLGLHSLKAGLRAWQAVWVAALMALSTGALAAHHRSDGPVQLRQEDFGIGSARGRY